MREDKPPKPRQNPPKKGDLSKRRSLQIEPTGCEPPSHRGRRPHEGDNGTPEKRTKSLLYAKDNFHQNVGNLKIH